VSPQTRWLEWERRAYLGGAVDSEAGDAGCGGGAYEGGRDGRDAGVLEVAVRVEEPHGGGGGARRSLGGHDRPAVGCGGRSGDLRLGDWTVAAVASVPNPRF